MTPARRRAVALTAAAAAAVAGAWGGPGPGGALPARDGRCPASHPVKAVVSRTTQACLYHLPGSQHYDTTTPDLCFPTEGAARADDCHRAEEVL